MVIHQYNSGGLTIGAVIGDNGANATSLTKAGVNNLILTGANTYTGGTYLNAGTLTIGASTTPTSGTVTSGPVGTGTVYLGGGTLAMSGSAYMLANALSVTAGTSTNVVTGSGNAYLTGAITGSGTFQNNSATSSSLVMRSDISGFTGTFAINSNSSGQNFTFDQASGSSLNGSGAKFVLTGATSGTARGLASTAGGTLQIGELSGNGGWLGGGQGGKFQIGALNTDSAFTGLVSSTSSIIKVGSGILYLGGANTYTGTTTVNEGALVAGNTTAFGPATNASLIFGAGSTGKIQINGNSMTVIALSTNAIVGTPVLENANAAATTLTVNNTASSACAATIQDGTGGGALSLVKSNTGTLTLSGGNSYTGGTTISAGMIKAGNATALGANGSAVSVTAGATLDLNGTTMTNTNALTLNGTGVSGNGALINNNSTAATYAGLLSFGSSSNIVAGAGDITLSNTGSITAAGSGYQLFVGGAKNTTIHGSIDTGTGTVFKQGAGTLTLTGANSYTGSTTVSVGTLSLGNGTLNSNLADTADVVIGTNSSATLNLNFLSGNTDTVKTLTIAGVQKAAGVWGSTTSGAPNTDTRLTGNGTLNVTTGPTSSSAYDTWANTTYGLSGANAAFDFDYENDGIKNGLEWILGGNPTTNSPGIIPAATRNLSGDLVLTFTRLEASISESTLVVEFGTDLATWPKQVTIGATGSGQDANGVTVGIDTAATPDAVTVTIPSSQAAGGKLFTRLKATKP